MFITTALGVVGLLLLLLLLTQDFNRLKPDLAARVLRWPLRKWSGVNAAAIAVKGRTTSYLHCGKGDVLVLLHDFAGGKDRFIEVARHLKDSMRVLMSDMPGHGEGNKDPQADYSIEAQVQRIRDFLWAHGMERVHLGGNGMGGCVAAWYAARYPDEVASVWLLNASATHDAWQAPWVKAYDATGQCLGIPEQRDQ